MNAILDVAADGSFCLHPISFAERVIDTIENDFATFEGMLTGTPGLPTISVGTEVTASGVQHNSSSYPQDWRRPK